MTAVQQGWTVPGWYTDPSGRYRLRYHDGAAWTLHVSDLGEAAVDDLPLDRLYRLLPPAMVAGGPPHSSWGDALLDVESCALVPAVDGSGPTAVNDEYDRTIAWLRTTDGSENPMATLTQVSRMRPTSHDLLGHDGGLRLRFRVPVSVFAPEIVVSDDRANELGRIVQQTTGPVRLAMSTQGLHQGVVEYDGTVAVARDSAGQPIAVVDDSNGAGPAIRFVRPVHPEVRALLLACLVGWDVIAGTHTRSFDTGI